MMSYSNGSISVSYFLKADLETKTIIFKADFSNLLKNSDIFSKSKAADLSVTVNTSPDALMACCDGFFMNTTTVKCDEVCGDGKLFEL